MIIIVRDNFEQYAVRWHSYNMHILISKYLL